MIISFLPGIRNRSIWFQFVACSRNKNGLVYNSSSISVVCHQIPSNNEEIIQVILEREMLSLLFTCTVVDVGLSKACRVVLLYSRVWICKQWLEKRKRNWFQSWTTIPKAFEVSRSEAGDPYF